jgi:ATP-dependent Lon protease
MFVGIWNFKADYKKGNIVYLPYQKEYFICISDHSTTEISYLFPPTNDSLWLKLDSKFLNNYLLSTTTSGLLFDFNNSNYNLINKSFNEDSNDDYDYEELENFVDIENLDKNTILFKLPENKKDIKLKRKLENAEYKLQEYKKRKLNNNVDDIRDKLLLLNLDISTKSFLIDKYDSTKRLSGTEYTKSINWLKTVCDIPHGKFKNIKINKNNKDEIKKFFDTARKKLDKTILGLDDVKDEILEFVARKITNPKSKGHVLALCGSQGVGKTKLSKSLADVLELPFFHINCGGLNDGSILVGHSETYVGAKPGKIVEILQKANIMNPIIYLDEIDKLGHKKQEINGILTHLLDEEQNDKFQDHYLSNINLNLSNIFFIISFNDITKVDAIVCDRMKVIYINPPTMDEKVNILQTKILPELIKVINLKENLEISKETIEYVILNKCSKEKGVRNCKKIFEKILYF